MLVCSYARMVYIYPKLIEKRTNDHTSIEHTSIRTYEHILN